MIVTTMDGIAGRMTQETLGVVRGSSMWTRRIIKSSSAASGTAVNAVMLPRTVPSYPDTPEMADEMDAGWGFLAARPSFRGSTLHH